MPPPQPEALHLLVLPLELRLRIYHFLFGTPKAVLAQYFSCQHYLRSDPRSAQIAAACRKLWNESLPILHANTMLIQRSGSDGAAVRALVGASNAILIKTAVLQRERGGIRSELPSWPLDSLRIEITHSLWHGGRSTFETDPERIVRDYTETVQEGKVNYWTRLNEDCRHVGEVHLIITCVNRKLKPWVRKVLLYICDRANFCKGGTPFRYNNSQPSE
jgi:hypothetical protein